MRIPADDWMQRFAGPAVVDSWDVMWWHSDSMGIWEVNAVSHARKYGQRAAFRFYITDRVAKDMPDIGGVLKGRLDYMMDALPPPA